MRSLGVPELLVIGAIVILLFGPKKVGELAKGLGEGLREFKKAHRDAEDAKKDLKA